MNRVDPPDDPHPTGPSAHHPHARAHAHGPTTAVLHTPSRHDPQLRPLTEVAGGPAGRRGAPRSSTDGWSWGPGAVLVIVIQIPLALAVLISGPCRATGWQSPMQFNHACYSDIAVAVSDTAVPLPAAKTMLVDAARAASVPVATLAGRPADEAALLRTGVDLLTLLISVAACVLVLAAVRLAGHRPWDAAMIAASPALVTSALVSLDLVGAALLVAGLAVFTWPPSIGGPRMAPLLAALMSGVLLGAATAVHPMAIVGPVVLTVLAIRAGQRALTGIALAGAAFTWFGLNLPAFVSGPSTWWRYHRNLVSAEPGYGSVLALPRLFDGSAEASQLPSAFALAGAVALVLVLALRLLLPSRVRAEWLPLRGPRFLAAAAILVLAPAVLIRAGPWLVTSALENPPTAGAAQWVAIVGSVTVLGAATWLVRTAQHRPRIPAIALVLIVGWWLVAPSLPVQAGLWVLPMLALTVPSWRIVVAWSAVEAIYAVLTWLYLYGLSVEDRGLPAAWFAAAVLARVLAWGWVATLAWRISARPSLDPVRNRPDAPSTQRDAPAGGLFDETADDLRS